MVRTWMFVLGGIIIVLLGLVFFRMYLKHAEPEGQACTLEAKLCPDGSYVGRTGPHCEFAACPSATSTDVQGTPTDPIYHSGVRGTVLLGPTCAVEKSTPDASCAPKPYATSIAVYQVSQQTPFLIGTSDARGVFSFSLPPGAYRLVAGDGQTLPRCESAAVTVLADTYASITLSCDSGIR